MENKIHPYLERNNGFELIGGNFWIKKTGDKMYEVVILNRFNHSIQKGWVDFFEINLTEISQGTIDKAWEDEDIEFDESLLSREQITAELLAKGDYVDYDEQNPFDNEEELVEIMKEYGIIDDLEI